MKQLFYTCIAVFVFVVFCSHVALLKDTLDCKEVCDPTDSSKACSITKPTKIIIEVNNTVEIKYYPFCVKVDDLSQLTLANTSTFMFNISENSTVRVWVGNHASSAEFYRSKYSLDGNDAFTIYYTVSINLASGLLANSTGDVPAINFINNCDLAKKSCSINYGNPCVREKQCGMYLEKSSPAERDVKFFISWTGTDNTGTPLRSYGLLPSNFRFLAFENYFNTIVDSFKVIVTPK
ncbi:hypothetical protein ABK040_014683 [Willaertia magna]